MLQICIVFKLLAVTIAAFLHENVIVRFGVPKVIVNDRRTHLHNELIEAMRGGVSSIEYRKTTLYHPHTNGLAERVNQPIVKILCKTNNNNNNKRDWDLKLPSALSAFMTTFKVTTNQAPFAFVYMIEAMLPIELEIPSLQIAVGL